MGLNKFPVRLLSLPKIEKADKLDPTKKTSKISRLVKKDIHTAKNRKS
jgi:hypothetical protein